jgi:hypothetical protein
MGAKWCDDQPVISVPDLGNAIEMDKDYPHLNIPNYQMISAIEPDDSVELTHQGDRFWVKVDIVDEDSCEFIGKVTDGLVFGNHPFTSGDCILFEGKNILNIHSREWKDELRISPNE